MYLCKKAAHWTQSKGVAPIMYYITNQNDHIIAADSQLLDLLSLTSMDDLHKHLALGNIEFTNIRNTVLDITLFNETQTYDCVQHSMSGIMGDITLVEIIVETEENMPETLEETEEDLPEEVETEDFFTLLEEEAPLSEELVKEMPVEETEEKESSIEKDELFDLLEEPLSLGSESEEVAEVSEYHDDTPIKIDSAVIAKEIGISVDDYERFLKEYIETAFTLEEDLKSSKEHAKRHAVTTL